MTNVISELNVQTQIGLEASLGAGGAAGKRLQSLMIDHDDKIATRIFRGQARRFANLSAIDKEWTEFNVKGDLLYTEKLYLLENFCGTVTATIPGGGVISQQRKYTLALNGAITPKSWTVMFGDPTDNVNQYSYGILTDLGAKYDRDIGCSCTGKGVAQLLTTGVTITPSATTLANVPILGSHLNIYLDTTGAGIGVTQITDEVLSVDWSITGMKDARWAMNRSKTSFASHVELPPKAECKIDFAENSVTRAIITNLKVGQTYFLRVDAQGGIIEGTIHYLDQTDIALQLKDISTFATTKGIYKRTLTFEIVEDPTWAAAINFTNVTKEATL